MKDLLHRYLQHECTPEELAQIADWLDADPANREVLDDMRLQFETIALIAPDLDRMHEQIVRRTGLRRRLWQWSAAAAAVVALCVGVSYFSSLHVRDTLGGKTMSFATQTAPVQYTLSDGTRVWLNAGSQIEYPAVFTGGERRVRVSGEALFEVEHDKRHPFIVETFACRVEVTGTRFNLEADEAAGTFCTALLEGQVRLTSLLDGETLTMRPDEVVRLQNGHLQRGAVRSHDDYLWPEGILSIGGCTFSQVAARLEKIYGVRIVLERTPTLDVERGKLWTSMGLEYVLGTLQDVASFRYTLDEQNNTVYIR